MPDAFVWYHADACNEKDILKWLEHLAERLTLNIRLYRRSNDGPPTYMEAYEHISTETLAEIERLAAGQSVFAGIRRHVETFDLLAHTSCAPGRALKRADP